MNKEKENRPGVWSMIKVGTCGFKFKDWTGVVYPEKLPEKEWLIYYDQVLGMDTVEIDASYYTLLSPRVSEAWIRKTSPGFTFAVKCHQEMTLNEKGKVDPLSVDNAAVFERFLAGFAPLEKNGRLLCYLAQFGPLFWKSDRALEYLHLFRERFSDRPLVVEFRHQSWLEGEEAAKTLEFLSREGLGYAAVDEPRLRTLAPFVPAATTDLAYFRLHGRSKQWFGAGAQQRYNYFYSDQELREFIPALRHWEGQSRVTLVYFNNCHAGAALKNAVQLKTMLGLENRAPAAVNFSSIPQDLFSVPGNEE